MNHKKRALRKFASLALTLVFAIGLMPMAAMAATGDFNDRADVPVYAASHFDKFIGNGIVVGGTDGNLMPNQKITMLQSAILLSKAFGLDQLELEDVLTGHFSDASSVIESQVQYINSAVALKVINGDGSKLDLSRTSKRYEMFTLINNVLQLTEAPEGFASQFTDVNDAPQWARKHILTAEYHGLIAGDGQGHCNPNELIDRAQMITLLSKAVGEIIDGEKDYADIDDVTKALIRRAGAKASNLKADYVLVSQGVGDGDVWLQNSEIEELVVRGGGENSIHIDNSSITSLSIETTDVTGPVRVVSENGATITSLVIKTADAVLIVEGNFETIVIEAEGVTVTAVGENTVIGKVEVKANDATVNVPNTSVEIDDEKTGTTVGGTTVGGGQTVNTGDDSTPTVPAVTVSGVKVIDGADGFTEVTTPVIGQVIRANILLSDGSTIGTYPVDADATYRWFYKESTDTVLGTTSSYTVTSDNVGKTICVEVTMGDKHAGTATWEAEAVVAAIAVSGVKVIDGADGYTEVTTPVIGQVIRANILLSDGSTIGTYPVDADATYRWFYKESTDTILGTTSSYTVTSDNVGKTICVEVTMGDKHAGTATWEAAAAVQAPVTVSSVSVIDGADGFTEVTTPVIGQVIRANILLSDGSTIGTYPVDADATYTWFYKESTDTILGTTSSYTVTSDNVGKTICVEVTMGDKHAGTATWEAAAVVEAE